jgi:hypothetical protein
MYDFPPSDLASKQDIWTATKGVSISGSKELVSYWEK